MMPVKARGVYIHQEAAADPRSMARIERMMPFVRHEGAPVVIDDAALNQLLLDEKKTWHRHGVRGNPDRAGGGLQPVPLPPQSRGAGAAPAGVPGAVQGRRSGSVRRLWRLRLARFRLGGAPAEDGHGLPACLCPAFLLGVPLPLRVLQFGPHRECVREPGGLVRAHRVQLRHGRGEVAPAEPLPVGQRLGHRVLGARIRRHKAADRSLRAAAEPLSGALRGQERHRGLHARLRPPRPYGVLLEPLARDPGAGRGAPHSLDGGPAARPRASARKRDIPCASASAPSCRRWAGRRTCGT